MALVKENIDEFNRHSCRYKQFKVHNTSRTSTPQPMVRPKHIRAKITSDHAAASLRPQPPSGCTDIDTAYVSYVQWRHYLLVPNSDRKFKVRYAGADENNPTRCDGSIISGNINMMPYFHPAADDVAAAQRNLCNKFSDPSKKRVDAKVEDALNSRILDKRNQRIADIVMPFIKKRLKRIFAGELGIRRVESQTPKICNNFRTLLRSRRERSEDRECLIDKYDSVGE